MDIQYPPNLISSIKNKFLLLDTNIFIDALQYPSEYTEFFNTLKKNDVTITTLHCVAYELLKGSSNQEKYKQTDEFIHSIVDTIIHHVPKIDEFMYTLIQLYGKDGSRLSLTDLYLGATLMIYKKNVYLFTRDTTDFIQNIFDLKHIINASHNKGIHTYGIYQYLKV